MADGSDFVSGSAYRSRTRQGATGAHPVEQDTAERATEHSKDLDISPLGRDATNLRRCKYRPV